MVAGKRVQNRSGGRAKAPEFPRDCLGRVSFEGAAIEEGFAISRNLICNISPAGVKSPGKREGNVDDRAL